MNFNLTWKPKKKKNFNLTWVAKEMYLWTLDLVIYPNPTGVSLNFICGLHLKISLRNGKKYLWLFRVYLTHVLENQIVLISSFVSVYIHTISIIFFHHMFLGNLYIIKETVISHIYGLMRSFLLISFNLIYIYRLIFHSWCSSLT